MAYRAAEPIGAGRARVAYLTVRPSNGGIAHSHVNWLSPTKVRTTLIGGSRRTLVRDDLNPQARPAVPGPGDFPVAERAARESPSLPLHPHLTESQQAFVVETITETLAR